MTIHQIVAEIRQRLCGKYPKTEIESFERILIRHFLNLTPAQAHMSRYIELCAEKEQKIHSAIDELQNHKPIQYIIGETEFYGLPFKLTPDVLIPRPETEELVHWILNSYDRHAELTMVDVGAGSGCISVSLAANLRNADIWAVDISKEGLAVARRNALKNKVKVHFIHDDILKTGTMGFQPDSIDVLVSNPPYVQPSERDRMKPNVLQYEPHIALFAPENDPVIFYKCIATIGTKCLKNKGKIFFEINEGLQTEVIEILTQNHYINIIPRRDINGKWRMVAAEFSRTATV